MASRILIVGALLIAPSLRVSRGQWFWCLNDRAPSPAADRGHAPSKGEAMLRLKRRWLERGPLKRGEMQMGRPKATPPTSLMLI
jgi:hypothetical protein